MKAYRFFYDFEKECWCWDPVATDLGETTEFQFWVSDETSQEQLAKVAEQKNRRRRFSYDELEEPQDYMIRICEKCKKPYILKGNQYQWFVAREREVPNRCKKCNKK